LLQRPIDGCSPTQSTIEGWLSYRVGFCRSADFGILPIKIQLHTVAIPLVDFQHSSVRHISQAPIKSHWDFGEHYQCTGKLGVWQI
jgi:hypothetical protein